MQATPLNNAPVVFRPNVERTFLPNSSFATSTFVHKGRTFRRHVYSDNGEHLEVIVLLDGNDNPIYLDCVMVDKTEYLPLYCPLIRPITTMPARIRITRETVNEGYVHTHQVEID